jgi:hypothetical protein
MEDSRDGDGNKKEEDPAAACMNLSSIIDMADLLCVIMMNLLLQPSQLKQLQLDLVPNASTVANCMLKLCSKERSKKSS